MPFSVRLLGPVVLVTSGLTCALWDPARGGLGELGGAYLGPAPEPLRRVAGVVAERSAAALEGQPVELEAEDSGEWPEPAAEELASLDTGGLLPEQPREPSAARLDAQGRPWVDLPPSRPLDPDRTLAALARETFVYQAPSFGAKRLGYLRAGALVPREAKPAGFSACKEGWYAIEPEGFVCVGKNATLDLTHPVVVATRRRPDRSAALPYDYAMSRFPTPPFYTKIPSSKEQRSVEHGLDKHLALTRGTTAAWQDLLGPVPALVADGGTTFAWGGSRHSSRTVYTGRALPKSGFAFLDVFEAEGRAFGLSVDLDVMPLDRMKRIEPSAFRGLALSDEMTLPIVFVRSRGARLYEGDPRTTGLVAAGVLEHRQAVPITGRRVRAGGVAYLETTSGAYLRDEHLTRVDPIKNRPGWATPGRTWIDVSILKQTLVAYEGTTPVYVTLVSTGAAGLGDPKKTHSTIRGQFLIHTKHVTATMSGDEVGDEFDLRDVPYVQYFMEGYAFHAAYWHESFGRPRSHGCINLSPIDAGWLFHWTDPPVPERWHGGMSLRQGTLVHIRP